MEVASPLLEIVKGLLAKALASKPLGYIYNLKDNVRSLDEANEILKAVSEDVKAKVEREEEEARVRRTNQVASWLGKVQDFVGGVDQVLREAEEHDGIKCPDCCLPRNCWSRYKLGKRVDQLLNEARQLQHEKGEFSNFMSSLPPPHMLEMPMDKTVGLDISLNKVWKWLVDEKKQVGVIGLYGTGGVGKTTLMKRINEELLHANHGFEVIIWVLASKQVNEDSIRDAIRKRLNIKDERWEGWSMDEKIHHLWDVLTEKKFVLLIDDVWTRLDLSKIGVPHPSPKNESKVVFTTRLKHACDQMGANKTLEVQCLKPKEALKLFEKNVGKSLVNCRQEIRELAKDIAEECRGLPLALIIVGRAMANKDDSHEWRHALTMLRNKPHKLQGMMGEVYHILKFGYDSLDDTTQACFLYCCLFPENYPIITNELIEFWIGEGLLGDINDLYNMRKEGASVLGDLKRACLLESELHSYSHGLPAVEMHGVIRDMTAWIARDYGRRENKLLVIEKEEDMSVEMISKWNEAEKVSLWGKWIRNIDKTPPRCSQLETLFIRDTKVMFVPRDFFDSMTARLTVLDLSDNEHIVSFPEGICNLINLRYLNLSATRIHELPKEIKNLTCLRWLLLDYISNNILIPIGAITSLPLNVFSQWMSQVYLEEWGLVKEEEIIEELGHMQHLTDLSIHVCKSFSAQKIFKSPNLRRCIRRACINKQRNLTSIVISYSSANCDGFLHLETLHFILCTELREMKITQGIGRAPNCSCFPSLVEVYLFSCGLSDLSWLVHAPELRKLKVEHCDSMEKIIGYGFAREELATLGLFSCLESLHLVYLPILTSICDQTLFFPPGVTFNIWDCPGIRNLPFDPSSTRRSFEVIGDKHWWAEFEWDPIAQVTLQLDGGGPMEEMTFGEAAQKVKDELCDWAKIGFLPRGFSIRT